MRDEMFTKVALESRRVFAARLRLRKAEIAERCTASLFQKHAHWRAQFGDRLGSKCVEDIQYHIDFLAASIESGSIEVFTNYVRWTARVLEARNVGQRCLSESLIGLMEACAAITDAHEQAQIELLLRDGEAALRDDHAQSTESEVDSAVATLAEVAMRGDRKMAQQIAEEQLRITGSLAAVYAGLIEPMMYEIGRRWELALITVAQEHVATAVIQYVLSQLYAKAEATVPTRGKVIVTGVPGEMHQVGALMVADVLELHGFRVEFLGTNVPIAATLSALEREPCAMLGISTTMPFNLPNAIALVEAMRARLQKNAPKLLVGGAAFRSARGLARELGALAVGTDLSAALALANGP